jgi:DNA-binding protein H-NS
MSPGANDNKTIVPEQERESTSTGANSHQQTPKSSSGIGSKESKQATQTAEKDRDESENEEEQGTEDGQKLLEALAKAGISTQEVLKMVVGKKKAANQRQKNIGAGRGRGGKTKK